MDEIGQACSGENGAVLGSEPGPFIRQLSVPADGTTLIGDDHL